MQFFSQVLMGKEEQKTPGFSHPQTPTPVFNGSGSVSERCVSN